MGAFLREHRRRLPPAPDRGTRRRTPGLRREDVAARAGVSVVWYTWLEQNRGGPPSDEVLERLCAALSLGGADREMLFLLGRHRAPPLRPPEMPPPVAPVVQRVMDAMPDTPALVKNALWDVVAWNRPAVALWGDYGATDPAHRNLLRRFFLGGARQHLVDWEQTARFLLGAFRVDVARAGPASPQAVLAAELQDLDPDFRRLWPQIAVGWHGVGRKELVHPVGGRLRLDYATFDVVGAEGLSMLVFTPAAASDRDALARMVAALPE
ncbi:helix-turn-helix transcriptional regulator [Acetobacteraceae bacterium KSS12]|uniref:Helix-turn-helix transcriptional regulator n=1 Tax=Rhizosaccharibacter radicis TaxID=2782605 RepID=A0ABT1VTT3_9PROT|nr:helix-turn-helix transcriptional regulator [Acetobacteraceae bacterium KSS12]